MAKRPSKVQAMMAPIVKAPRPLLTREQKCANRILHITGEVSHELRRLKADVERFTADILKDPLYTLRWADDFIGKAAKQKVYLEINHVLETNRLSNELNVDNPRSAEAQYDGIRNWIIEKVLYQALQFPSSTSQLANLTENRERQAWAELVGSFGGLFCEVNADEA